MWSWECEQNNDIVKWFIVCLFPCVQMPVISYSLFLGNTHCVSYFIALFQETEIHIRNPIPPPPPAVEHARTNLQAVVDVISTNVCTLLKGNSVPSHLLSMPVSDQCANFEAFLHSCMTQISESTYKFVPVCQFQQHPGNHESIPIFCTSVTLPFISILLFHIENIWPITLIASGTMTFWQEREEAESPDQTSKISNWFIVIVITSHFIFFAILPHNYYRDFDSNFLSL